MLAARSIDALLRQHQPFDRLPADNVQLHNLLNVRERDVPIPHTFGINDEVRPMLTLIQAS
jgi:hypothetical protein